jgi:hypothetical protein
MCNQVVWLYGGNWNFSTPFEFLKCECELSLKQWFLLIAEGETHTHKALVVVVGFRACLENLWKQVMHAH